ncbi:MAG: hypothetical protein FRX49_06802 [Trebouxia sp. A1-2]|nr:MAG: hypothetical protein FRX49_06802 [Trebouxia sp. A1-2]
MKAFDCPPTFHPPLFLLQVDRSPQGQCGRVSPDQQGHLQAALPCLHNHDVIHVVKAVWGEGDCDPNMHPGGYQAWFWGF